MKYSDNTIPNFSDSFDELEKPEFLNGMEVCNFPRKYRHLSSYSALEVYRRVQSLYDSICSGRFNLCNACKLEFPEYLDSTNTEEAHIWIRTQFTNNAILWYNATFDLLLQVVWFYYELYKKLKKPMHLSTRNIEDIMRKCTLENIKANTSKNVGIVDAELLNNIEELHNKFHAPIAKWANTIKHRSSIVYADMNYHDTVTLQVYHRNPGENILDTLRRNADLMYNSKETIKEVHLNDVLNSLIKYHKALIKYSEDMVITMFPDKFEESEDFIKE